MTNENPFGETIYSYSRGQAIADGVLTDLSQVDSIRQHWKHPFACTSAVWAIIEVALPVSHLGQNLRHLRRLYRRSSTRGVALQRKNREKQNRQSQTSPPAEAAGIVSASLKNNIGWRDLAWREAAETG
jgi:hypothetical protein